MDSTYRGHFRAHNRLIQEKSPYLLQHAKNPVDWYPWGEAAFEKARREDKPIFLSIGYATCHWCHVMAHESFEDHEVARLLNQSFVAVKVDREERPDIDQVYMTVCQLLTGRGGWPLSIFMTPEGKPFFAGTYFPKTGRMGMPGFTDVLTQLALLWNSDRQRLLNAAEEITKVLQPGKGPAGQGPDLDLGVLEKGYRDLAEGFDSRWGGFGQPPKFPAPHQLTFLLRWHARSGDSQARFMVEKTLDAMRYGGIYDQIGYGFHRYSVDEKWLVPHFEKMLYDQAMLAMAYTEAHQLLGGFRYAQTVREILAYVTRDMTDTAGGFYSAEDADSEGKEGLFYVWKPQEIKRHLGSDLGELFCRFYDITPGGNFEEGWSIPHVPVDPQTFAARQGMEQEELEKALRQARERLFVEREKRVHPLKDDKILTSWNGLMIAAMAKAYQALGEPAYAQAAERAACFILEKLRQKDGTLLRRYRQGHVAHAGYLDDYAFLVWGLIELYEALFQEEYLEQAVALNRTMMDLFWDRSAGGLYFTPRNGEVLIARSKELYDGALPSGNSVAALNLLRLSRMTGDPELERKAQELFEGFAGQVASFPKVYTQLLNALDFALGPGQEIVIAGDPRLDSTRAMVKAVHGRFLPRKVLLLRPPGAEGQRISALCPFVEDMVPANGEPVAYICQQYACQAPVKDLEALEAALG